MNEQYKIGFNTQDITPSLDLDVRLGGYFRLHKVAKNVLHPIKSRAMCIKGINTGGKNGIILISADLVGGQYRWTYLCRKIISRKTNVPISNILIHFTHSHSSPDMIGIFPNRLRNLPRTDVQYPVLKHIMKYIIKSAILAHQDATRDFLLSFGETKELEKPIAKLREPPYNIITAPIRFIKITDLSKEKILGVLINYQGHPTQLPQQNSDISCEYPGLVAESLMADPDLPHILHAAFFNGAIGDVSVMGGKGYLGHIFAAYVDRNYLDMEEIRSNPGKVKEVWRGYKKMKKDKKQRDEYEILHQIAMKQALKSIEEFAQQIANLVKGAWVDDKMELIPLEILLVSRRFVFPKMGRKKPFRKRWVNYHGFKSKMKLIMQEVKDGLRIFFFCYGYRIMAGRFMPMLNLRKHGYPWSLYHQTELQIFQINDIYWFAAPGEPFYLYQEQLTKNTPKNRAFFSCHSNDTCGYIFPWSFYAQGGYETFFSFDMLFGTKMYQTFKNMQSKLIKS